MRSKCANDLNALESFDRVVDIDPIVIPNCSMLPEPNAGQAPECFLNITVPDFENYKSKFLRCSICEVISEPDNNVVVWPVWFGWTSFLWVRSKFSFVHIHTSVLTTPADIANLAITQDVLAIIQDVLAIIQDVLAIIQDILANFTPANGFK